MSKKLLYPLLLQRERDPGRGHNWLVIAAEVEFARDFLEPSLSLKDVLEKHKAVFEQQNRCICVKINH